MELSTLLILLAFALNISSPNLYISNDGVPACSLDTFSVGLFAFDFLASCEKLFATEKKLFTQQLSYKNISTLNSSLNKLPK